MSHRLTLDRSPQVLRWLSALRLCFVPGRKRAARLDVESLSLHLRRDLGLADGRPGAPHC